MQATTTRLHIMNSHVASIKYHMHYPIFMACTGAAVMFLTSYPYTVWTRVSCQAVSPTNGLGTRLIQPLSYRNRACYWYFTLKLCRWAYNRKLYSTGWRFCCHYSSHWELHALSLPLAFLLCALATYNNCHKRSYLDTQSLYLQKQAKKQTKLCTLDINKHALPNIALTEGRLGVCGRILNHFLVITVVGQW